MKTFADRVMQYYADLTIPDGIPAGIEAMLPFPEIETWNSLSQFYKKYFTDNQPRVCIFGINPGRFGGGITGIPFTDPVKLANVCGIQNPFPKKEELSSTFIYRMISDFGGAELFYHNFFLTALSPIGFTKDAKNFNFYDDNRLMNNIELWIVAQIKKHFSFGCLSNKAICLGSGKNYSFFSRINQQHQLFKEIIALEHPRFILQYRRSQAGKYIEKYIETLNYCKD